tara:strand:- start:600 stop:782 length:183 start_codon:yes stop_codon:yes gene_type:complete
MAKKIRKLSFYQPLSMFQVQRAQTTSKGNYKNYLQNLRNAKLTGKKRRSGFRVRGDKPFR